MRAIVLALGAAFIAIEAGLATPLATKVFPNNDVSWFWVSAGIVVIGILTTIGAWLVKPEGAERPVDQSVRSSFQFGGVTAHTVNLAPTPRNVADPKRRDELERAIHQLDPAKPVVVGYPLSDQEAAQYADQIRRMLEMQGAQVDFTAWAVANPAPGVGCYPETNTIFVGSQ